MLRLASLGGFAVQLLLQAGTAAAEIDPELYTFCNPPASKISVR